MLLFAFSVLAGYNRTLVIDIRAEGNPLIQLSGLR
jgi:hypothetical protein